MDLGFDVDVGGGGVKFLDAWELIISSASYELQKCDRTLLITIASRTENRKYERSRELANKTRQPQMRIWKDFITIGLALQSSTLTLSN